MQKFIDSRRGVILLLETRIVADYAGALYNLGIAYLRLGEKSATREVIEKVRPLNYNLHALLWQELLALERPANMPAATTPTPNAPPPTPSPSP